MENEKNESTDGNENATPAEQEGQSDPGTTTPPVDQTNPPAEGYNTNPPQETGEQTPPAVPEVPEHTPAEETPAPEETPKEGTTGHLYEQKESGGFDADAEIEATKPHIHSKNKNWDDGAGREWPRSR